MRIDVDHDVGETGDLIEQGMVDVVRDRVALMDREGRQDRDVELGEQPMAAPPRPGVRDVLDPVHRARDRLDQREGALIRPVQRAV